MSNSTIPVKMKATLKIEKYPEGTTEEQIKNGDVEPEEVTISEDEFSASQEQVDDIFGKDEEE